MRDNRVHSPASNLHGRVYPTNFSQEDYIYIPHSLDPPKSPCILKLRWDVRVAVEFEIQQKPYYAL